jgi:ribosomal-protein-alanine N-acetyltransferase
LTNAGVNPELDIRLRPMTAADLDAVGALEKEIFPDAWPRGAFEDIVEEDAWHGLVAEIEGQVGGYGCFLTVAGEAHLANIAVAPAHRRKSVAKHILNHILQFARRQGCGLILLEVRPTNTAARRFYEQAGFSELYRRPEYYHDPVEDAVVMSLPLMSAGDDPGENE